MTVNMLSLTSYVIIDMYVNRSITNRLIDWIQDASLEKTFTSVANDIGVDEIHLLKN